MLKDFYSTHFGKLASTEQLRETVEKHVGAKMDWFFDQWVYGSSIPTYNFSYRLDELGNGEYRATVRVRQENVPDDFQMIVPIDLDFGEQGSARVNIVVRGPLTEAALPILPMKPVRVEFNAYEAVLAETKTEKWRS